MDAQLKKGVIEMCILYQLVEREAYGYEIMKAIKHVFPEIYDGSIYAVLRRLNTAGHAEIEVRESPSGPPRKYYRITGTGFAYLQAALKEWRILKVGVETLGIC